MISLLTVLGFFLTLQAVSLAESIDIEPTFADVAYGPELRQKLDFYQVKSDKPAPLLIVIHGGGWLHGDKKAAFQGFSRFFLRGASIACINYRFTTTDPLPAPVLDGARAVQFLRSKAQEWNLDSSRFLVCGVSAGGCTSLWLGTHEDLADPNAEDPVLRQSTRVCGVAALSAQTTIQPDQIREWIGERGVKHGMICHAGGFKNNEKMDAAIKADPKVAQLYKEFSPVTHLTPDDPPILLYYGVSLDDKIEGIHHSLFGFKFKERADEIGLKQCYFSIRLSQEYIGYKTGIDGFIADRLAIPASTPKKSLGSMEQ
jgi:arylformamidase